MAITALPTPPTRSDPTSFATRADAFMLALPTFATEANVVQADVNAKQTDIIARQTDVTTKQTDVTTKQTTASAAAVAAAASQTAAAGSATAAGNSATAAAGSATAADNTKHAIDAKWLGSKTADPTLDNDGNALTQGSRYWNSATQKEMIRGTSSWVVAAYDITVAGAAIGSANVPDYVVKRDGAGSFAGQVITAQDFNTLSDRTLKCNVVYTIDGLANIAAMKPAKWYWKNNQKKSYGLIAQDLLLTHPELVNENEDGTLGINYIPIIGFLLDAVKTLEAEVNKLKPVFVG